MDHKSCGAKNEMARIHPKIEIKGGFLVEKRKETKGGRIDTKLQLSRETAIL